MSKIFWLVFALGIMMISPDLAAKGLNVLMSNPIVFLAGFTPGIVIGVAWNNKEVKGFKAERDAARAEKVLLDRDIKRCEKDFETLKTKMAPYTKLMY